MKKYSIEKQRNIEITIFEKSKRERYDSEIARRIDST
jgi:hypothetical protein